MENFYGRYVTLPPSRNFPVYVGSDTEGIVLSFGMICLVLYIFLTRNKNIIRNRNFMESDGYIHLIPNIFILLVITFSILNVAIVRFIPTDDGYWPNYRQIHFITPPLISVCLFYLARSAVGRGWRFGAAVSATAIMAIVTLGFASEGKLMIFIALALALYVVRLTQPTPSRLILTAAGILFVCVIMVQTVQAIRTPEESVPRTDKIAWFMDSIVWKVVLRQTESGFCFRNVMKDHFDTPFEPAKQLFWLKGLVPRVIWPDKPSLSLGAVYATRYCGIPIDEVTGHSSSITLLGQPVIRGGWIGLFVHAGLLLFALAAIERLNADPHTLSAVVTGALLPWLIDFDQDFALYIANAVKFALVMVVVIIPVAMTEKHRSSVPG